jgi:hypothetical protein
LICNLFAISLGISGFQWNAGSQVKTGIVVDVLFATLGQEMARGSRLHLVPCCALVRQQRMRRPLKLAWCRTSPRVPAAATDSAGLR